MFARKSKRGDGYFSDQHGVVVRNDEFYGKRNFNEVQEAALASWEDLTTKEMIRIARLCELDTSAPHPQN